MVLTAIFHAKPGQEKQLGETLKAMFPHVEKETGALTYNLHESESKSGMFFFYEKYKDKEAFEHHGSTLHFKELDKNLEGLLTEPPVVEFYREIASMERGKSA